MRKISLWAAAPLVLAALLLPAHAQSVDRPTNIPTKQQKDGPFGTQWAKPPGTTGSHIYNDPRRRDPNSSIKSQRSRPCPAPTIYDPASGGCR